MTEKEFVQWVADRPPVTEDDDPQDLVDELDRIIDQARRIADDYPHLVVVGAVA